MPRSLLPRFAVTDARGVRLPLRTLRDRRFGLEDSDRAAELRGLIQRRPFRRILPDGCVVAGLVFGALAPALNTALCTSSPGRAPLIDSLEAGAIVLVPLVLLRLLLIHLLAPRTAARIAQDFLRLGHCPSCAYDLINVEPDADGITCCPECGAAWRGVQQPTTRTADTAP